jgi:hypothetical protein
MTESCGLLQFKGMNKAIDVWPIPAVGRSPSSLPDHPVWKIAEPAVALGLLEVTFLAHLLNTRLNSSTHILFGRNDKTVCYLCRGSWRYPQIMKMAAK